MRYALEQNGGCVVARFIGYLDEESGQKSAGEFAELLRGKAVEVVFDVREMTGYASAARAAWQQELWPVRDCIKSIEVIGGGALVRLGASTLALFLRVPVSFSAYK